MAARLVFVPRILVSNNASRIRTRGAKMTITLEERQGRNFFILTKAPFLFFVNCRAFLDIVSLFPTLLLVKPNGASLILKR